MRSLLLGILLASTSVLAAPPGQTPPKGPTAPATRAPVVQQPTLPPVVLEELPEACRDLGKLANAPAHAQALSARISLSSCIVDHEMRDIQLCDCEQSIKDIEAASEQSLALLDEVFMHGDPTMKILARQALGDLLTGFATRMLATVPAPVDGSEAAIALRETRLQMLQPLVQPWIVRAQGAYAELDRIARANPQLAKNPAVVAAVRASREKLQAQGQVVRR